MKTLLYQNLRLELTFVFKIIFIQQIKSLQYLLLKTQSLQSQTKCILELAKVGSNLVE